MQSVGKRFTFQPIERVEQGAHRGGGDDEDFDPAILPFDLGNDVIIEDISGLLTEDEFEVYRLGIGTYAHARLEGLRYALVHRYPEYELDDDTGALRAQNVMFDLSERKLRETAACLRLIRPIPQYLHLFRGRIGDDGRFTQVGMDTPLDYISNPLNQRNFGFRTKDAYALRRLVPLLQAAMAGDYWKFRMALSMHEAGCFLHTDWKAKFFLWTTSVESIFTTLANQGSLVSSERIKFFLGADAVIYPPGDLVFIYPDPKLTVGDVIGEIYCLRNHIAHGDRVPDYYFRQEGRPSAQYGGDKISKCEMLFEAISFLIRASLIKILGDDLIGHFRDNVTADAYFGSYGLTKKALRDAKITMPTCAS